jgi:hypothetical protein
MLATVGEYVTEARTLLQDKTSPFRYTDAELKAALGMALYEMHRLRYDLFMGAPPDVVSSTGDGTAITLDTRYRMPLVWYMVGQAFLRDEEEADLTKAAGFKDRFTSTLTKPEA